MYLSFNTIYSVVVYKYDWLIMFHRKIIFIMASKSKTMIKIAMLFLVINGALFLSSAAGSECYRNLKAECQTATFEALCQDPDSNPITPIAPTVTKDCCFEILKDNLGFCINDQMVVEASYRCKLDPRRVEKRSNQILSHCVTDITFPSLAN